MAHLLTFNCYGTHLRGDETGSVDRTRPQRGGPLAPSVHLVNHGKRIMTYSETSFNPSQSLLVLNAIQKTCAFRNWTLLAAHVRSTHVHLVVDGIADVSHAIRDLKAYASRALNGEGPRRWWARGANARRLRDDKAIRAAIRYVVEGQGTPMAVYVAAPDL